MINELDEGLVNIFSKNVVLNELCTLGTLETLETFLVIR